MTPESLTPKGVTFNGRSELIKGRALLHFTHESGRSFSVKESEATPEKVAEAMRNILQPAPGFMLSRSQVAACFGPVPQL